MSKYGHFDDINREYVITSPDTPAPWVNYLGDPKYGAIISNNAGGYSFVRDGGTGRILRFRPNGNDKPGRYIYLRDDESGEYWSASWQPCAKDLNEFKSECRHGTGYTKLKASYKGIDSEALYYVPLGKTYEVWSVTIKNTSDKARDISVFGYAELTNNGNYNQDGVNIQYSQFASATYFEDNVILQVMEEFARPEWKGGSPSWRYFTMCGDDPASYCGDKDNFIGKYRDYGNPIMVEAGKCDDKTNYGGNSCGAIQSKSVLQPGESRTVTFVLGQNCDENWSTVKQSNKQEAINLRERYAGSSVVQKELEELRIHWHSRLGNLKIESPDENFNRMVNTWNAYQCFITFTWSRAASYTYCGERNGYGYRDTVQDIQGIIHQNPEMARDKIEFMLSAQMSHGGGLPLVEFDFLEKKAKGVPMGPESDDYVKRTDHPSYRADDALWLFPTVFKYIAESGNTAFLDKIIDYADNGQGTVYDHLLKAIDFSHNHLAKNGLPAGLHADWNDCLRLGKQGVSSFVAFQLYYAYEIMSRFAAQKNDKSIIDQMNKSKEDFGKLIDQYFWDGDRFIRGITESGEDIGRSTDKEASVWLNPQSWAVISRFALDGRGIASLDNVDKHLNTKYGVKLINPPYREHAFDGAVMVTYPPGMKENSGIFLHPQGWIILAEALMGRGNQAFKYYTESCPAAQDVDEIIDIRRLEPYTYGQFTESNDSPNEGRSHVHWLTGTASTVMVSSVEGILGLRPDLSGITISPSVPGWESLKIEKIWRGKKLNITLDNPGKKESGFEVILNGSALGGNRIPFDLLEGKDEHEIVLK